MFSSPKLTPEIKTSDNMQRTLTLQPRQLIAAQAVAGHTTSVWQVGGVLLWLVALSGAAIRHQLSPLPLLLCCACVCGVSRVSRAPRKIRIHIVWIFGNMVKWSRFPILDLLELVRASQSSCFFFCFFFQLFFPTFFFNFFFVLCT